MKLGLGLALALAAALVLNIGFFVQHGATGSMPSLSLRHPFHSVRALVTSRQWMFGYATGLVGWGIYIAALSLAPLSLVQAVAAPHIPPELHVSTLLPEHCTAPGVHVPVQAPETHAEPEQATAEPHVPLEVQVCTPLPLHCVCPGAHTPAQLPETHVWFTHATAAPQVPLALQVSSPLPTHCVEPGVHARHSLFQHAGVAPEHVAWVCQLPVASHVWTRFATQRV